ncbi:hypothetical protein HBH56_203050 [Parastagonospora nodorum]|uniref:Uncharacterized protein n=2 Tax=Phaeosphaeria nodorum (strain SN15 / ATCC MYA-4574 / FGSC 10173) TaxID=321614 RepID=A0A7U2FAK1_PHANO|nr:hypothetical protein SNOG_14503 [Parastagonospora nodorum SN15]KAH3906393.1 hypothetical protein HBH56_203050 [Parastagonospora nodorum]EAT78043.1 hypothetical protein SNOG_14503 [Parastagonospora nodorum SN15]KAH3923863.1 hypothetical protein HBH54_201920 [Parastagonospora nodorum]KAH4129799.1 hypothetical protein HBH45_200050 [Parastagonospora nodorum]KAH4149815.1 hypothetical protein HBH44_190370 [Parastagonospora nodorum]
MSSPTAQLPTAQEGSKQGDQGPDQLELRRSAQNEDSKSVTPQPDHVETGKEQFNALTRSMQTPADRKCISMVCTDGVYRVLHYLPTPPDLPTDYEIYDAKPMSPSMIKAYLDTRRWSQATEDRFRGADGRTIPQEQWLRPPPGIIPPRGSKNERDENMRKYREEKEQLEQKITRGEISPNEPVACNSIKSDYDLRPR